MPPSPVTTTVRWSALFCCLFGLSLPFLSLPLFALGYWDKAQPLVVGLDLCASLSAFALAIRSFRSPQSGLAIIAPPIIAIPLLFGLLSCALSARTDLPFLSILGAPQSGNGALWYLAFGILIALARCLSEDQRSMRILAWSALAATALLAAIKAWDWHSDIIGQYNLLIWVASYYAWFAPAAVLVTTAPESKLPRWAKWAACFAGGTLVVVSRSATAVASVGAGILCWAAVHWAVRHRMNERRIRFLLSALAVGVLGAPILIELYIPAVRQIASIDDRYRLLLMLTESIRSGNWTTWLFGFGWGRIEDAYQIFLNASQMPIWDGKWIFLQSDYFHSHNGTMEALHGNGLIGVLFIGAMMIAVPASIRAERLPQAAAYTIIYAGLAALWFPLALSLPVMALALGILIGPNTKDHTPIRMIPVLFVAVGAAFLLAAFVEFSQARNLDQVRRSLVSGQNLDLICPNSPRGDDLALAEIFRDSLAGYKTPHDDAERQRQMRTIGAMSACLDRKIPTSHTPLLSITGLSLISQVYFTQELAWAAPEIPVDRWDSWLTKALNLAPGRSDLAIAYLTHEATAGHPDVVRRLAGQILSRDKNDAVGLYFLGLAAVQTGETATGLNLLRQSVDSGIERFMPLDPTLRNILYPGRN